MFHLDTILCHLAAASGIPQAATVTGCCLRLTFAPPQANVKRKQQTRLLLGVDHACVVAVAVGHSSTRPLLWHGRRTDLQIRPTCPGTVGFSPGTFVPR